MIDMNKVVSGVATYNGRDACIRVTAYFTLFLYGLLKDIDTARAQSCRILSKQFATARLIARFFDNIPAIFKFYRHVTEKQDAAISSSEKKKEHEPPKRVCKSI